MTLWELFLEHDQRVIHKWPHYFPVYEHHFQRYVDQPITLIEIGCGEGGSLQMWKRYFGPRATVIGLDVNPECQLIEEDQIHIRIGAQQDTAFLDAVLGEFGRPDIVIDDGSHVMADVCATFRYLYPKVADTGLYLVEDMHTAYWPEYGGGVGREGSFIELCKGLIDELHADYTRNALPASDFTRSTTGIHFYDGMIVLDRAAHEAGIPVRRGRLYLPTRLINFAEQAIAEQRPEAAVELIAPALVEGGDARLHHIMGVAKAQLGETQLALGHFTEAVRLAPNFNVAVYALGFLLSNLGRFAESAEYFQRSVALDPHFERNRYLLAVAYIQAGTAAAALPLLEQLRREDPQNQRLAEIEAHAHASVARSGSDTQPPDAG